MKKGADPVAARIRIKGRVQGVGYRFFVQETAEARGLKGWVTNLPGGDVECEVAGPLSVVERWLDELRKGPPLACVDELQVEWIPAGGPFTGFSIR